LRGGEKKELETSNRGKVGTLQERNKRDTVID